MNDQTSNMVDIDDEALDAAPPEVGPCIVTCTITRVSDESLDAPEEHAVPCPAQNGPCGIIYVSDEALDAAERPAVLCTVTTPCVVCRVSDEARAAL